MESGRTYFDAMAEQGLLSERLQAVLDELQGASAEYSDAKREYDRATVRFDMALERLKGAKQQASEMMTTLDWYVWGTEHPEVRFAGSAIGSAILTVLRDNAHQAARLYADEKMKAYYPHMTLDAITTRLEAGGYEFRTSTPGREVNAALINLQGITRTQQQGGSTVYASEDFGLILIQVQEERKRALDEALGLAGQTPTAQ